MNVSEVMNVCFEMLVIHCNVKVKYVKFAYLDL